MATTDELLAAAEASEDSTVLVVDWDTREITIPSTVAHLGVESDDETTRLYFECPSTYGEFDISTFGLRVNYENCNSSGTMQSEDTYHVEDATVSDGVISFSWLVGRQAYTTKGVTNFIVCGKLIDSDGNVTNEINTTVASLSVLEGLETTEAIVAENADIIEQILELLDTVGQPSAEDIASAVSDYLDENGVSVDIPDTLPNPYALTLTGGASATYDGSKAVSVEIPEQTTVTVEQTLTSGTKIGSVNGTALYAPSSSGGTTAEAEVTQLLTEGTAIATVNGTIIYAPKQTEVSVTQTLTSGTAIGTINGVTLYAPSYTNGDEVNY